MALETWLIKVKNAVSNRLDVVRTSSTTTTSVHVKTTSLKKSSNVVGVLAFEVASLMSKVLHLWQSLSDANIVRVRNESISLEGVHKIVSNDEAFLLGLACAEFTQNLRLVANSVSRLTPKCDNADLRSFDRLFDDFAYSGRDPHNWILNEKEMEGWKKKVERLISVTGSLHREMDEVSIMETSLIRKLGLTNNYNILDLQQKMIWQTQEIKYLKQKSLWNTTFDTVISILATSIFTTLARIKVVFGLETRSGGRFPRSLSAVVHPLMKNSNEAVLLEWNSKLLLRAPPSTLGGAGLALHYANLIIVMDKMIKSPELVGVDGRDDLYSMLPKSVRSGLRGRLRGVGFRASDRRLAGEWREAMGRILEWLCPLGQNMIKWQSERSCFEQQDYMLRRQANNPKSKIKSKSSNDVMLFQTLYFANKDKTEAAIIELLVGFNYIWRFQREITANAFFANSNNL